jgi:OOP family OmpA-OmpF porin
MCRTAVLACAGLLVGLGCAGCGGLTTVAVSKACTWTSPTAAGNSSAAGVQASTVVLIDVSASYWPRQGDSKSLPDGPEQTALNALVSDFGSGGTRLVSVGTFDGSSSTVSWQLGNVPLPPATGTSQNVQLEHNSASKCLMEPVEKAMDTTPQAAGTDGMAALGAAGAELGTTPASRSHVLLITDGLSNTGCLNLNKVLSQGQSASDVVSSCPDQRDLSRLRGADVRLVGVGFQALYPPMPSSQQTWLENYWSDVCTALKVQSPGSCVQPQTTNTVRTSNVTRPSDPVIVFPHVGRGSKVVIPAPLLFAFDSATLTQTAESYLNILIGQIKASGRPITSVIGHTDSVGSSSYNMTLSLLRAQAVQSYLAANGFAGIKVQGVGFTQPACTPEYISPGKPNEVCMAKNRRVEINLGG